MPWATWRRPFVRRRTSCPTSVSRRRPSRHALELSTFVPRVRTSLREPSAFHPDQPLRKRSSASNKGERAADFATQAHRPGGNARRAASAASTSSKRTKHPPPVPVRQASPCCESSFSTASTRGCRRRNTGSKALPRTFPERKSDIFAGAASRVKSGAWKSSAVATATPESTIKKAPAGKSTGVRRSPTPSAQAVRPRPESSFRQRYRHLDRSSSIF